LVIGHVRDGEAQGAFVEADWPSARQAREHKARRMPLSSSTRECAPLSLEHVLPTMNNANVAASYFKEVKSVMRHTH
jgi:hypothetical protein